MTRMGVVGNSSKDIFARVPHQTKPCPEGDNRDSLTSLLVKLTR